MAERGSSGSTKVSALPPTLGISDPHMRAWADAMASAWSVRNGGGGPDAEQFVRKADIDGAAASAVVRVLTGDTAGASAAASGGVPSVQAVVNEVLGSKVVEYLRTPAAQIAAPTSQFKSLLDRVRTGLTDEIGFRQEGDAAINSRVDLLEANSGSAGALVAQEAAARAAGDTANASLITAVQSAVYRDFEAGPNLVLNPGFLADSGGWDGAGASLTDASSAPTGAPSNRVLRSNTRDVINGRYIRVTPGEILDGSVWAASFTPTGASVQLLLQVINTDNTAVIAYPQLAGVGPGLTGWTELVGSYTVPNGAGFVRVDLQIDQTQHPGGAALVYFAQPTLNRRSGGTAVSMAAVLSETTTRVTKDNALAQALNTVWSVIGGSSALIQDGALAAISPAAVTATKWQQVQAAVTDPNTGAVNAVSLKQELNAYASKVDGSLNATWGVKMNVNGVATGLALMTSAGAGSPSGMATSSFAILADRLSLVSPTNQSVLPFTVDNLGNAIFNGIIYAAGGSFAGALAAATGTFRGALSAATGTFAGALTAATGSFAGSLSAATGSFAGTLTADAVSAVSTINLAGNSVSVAGSASGAAAAISTSLVVPSGQTMIVMAVATLASVTDQPAPVSGGLTVTINGNSYFEPTNSSISASYESGDSGSRFLYYTEAKTIVHMVSVAGPATVTVSASSGDVRMKRLIALGRMK